MSLVAAVAAIALGHAQIDPNLVIWHDYKSGSQSRAVDQREIEIFTLADFQRYREQFAPEGVGDGRDVQWGKEELIAIHLGPRSSGGYSVQVDRITKVKPTEARVDWAELTPTKGLEKGREGTSPWTIVRVNRTGTHITFAGSRREAGLPGGIKIIDFAGFGNRCSCCEACERENRDRLPWRAYAAGDDAPVLLGSTYVMSSPLDYAHYVHNYRMDGLGDGSDIDWYHRRLLAIHLGRKLTDGYRIAVTGVRLIDSTRVDVTYTEVQPVGGTLSATSSRGPYLLLEIPRVGSLVTFTRQFARSSDRLPEDRCNCTCAGCSCHH